MKKILIKLLFVSMISSYVFKINNLKAFVPHYYFPTQRSLKKESIFIGQNAVQLLNYGRIKDSLILAKVAVKINNKDENLWTILAEIQIANALYQDALISLKNAQEINPQLSDIYFAKSTIYLKQEKTKKAKLALQSGIKISPKNYKAIFQLGNISLMEENFINSIDQFDKAIQIEPDFWQAINNKGLAYYEIDKLSLSIKYFRKAIALKENAESILALASCMQTQNINEAIFLAKKALKKDPNYVDYKYRKEQLWGNKLQNSTEELFKNSQLKKEIIIAKTKIN